MVVGHTGCGGCIAAFDQPIPTVENPGATPLVRYLEPIIRLKHSLPEGSDVNDLIKENVKMAVKNVVNSPVSLPLIDEGYGSLIANVDYSGSLGKGQEGRVPGSFCPRLGELHSVTMAWPID